MELSCLTKNKYLMLINAGSNYLGRVMVNAITQKMWRELLYLYIGTCV